MPPRPYTIPEVPLTPATIDRLDNGAGIVVRTMRQAPVVALQVWLDAGAADDPDDFPGMAHLLEHLLFKGNPSRRFQDLVATVEAVGGSFEAWTSHDHTVYELLRPARHARLGLDVLADALGPLSVDPDVLAQEMAIITQEERQRADDVWTDAADVLVALAFEGHPYGRSVTGDPRKLRRATAADVAAFHERTYRGERMTLVVVGAVDVARSPGRVPSVRAIIASVPPDRWSEAFDAILDAVAVLRRTTVPAVEVHGGGLATVGIGFRVPGARDPATAPLALLDTVLGDGPASLLQAGLVRARELALHVEVAQYPERDASVLAIIASVPPDRWSEAFDAILDAVAVLRRTTVPAVDLERARHLIAAEALYAGEAVEDVAERIGFDVLSTGDADYETVFQAQVAAAAAADVREAAVAWFRAANMGAVVVLPQKDEEPTDDDIDEVRERIRVAVHDRLADEEQVAAATRPLDVKPG